MFCCNKENKNFPAPASSIPVPPISKKKKKKFPIFNSRKIDAEPLITLEF